MTEYDSDGNRTKDIDGNGNATTYVYDVFHRKVQSIDPLGNISQTDYDKASNISPSGSSNYNLTHHTIFLLGRNYTYDSVNRRTKRIDFVFTPIPLGIQRIVSANSKASNLAASAVAGSPTIVTTYTYDFKGRVIAVTDGNGNTSEYQYDNADRKIQETDPMGNYKVFEYDPDGNLTRADSHEIVATSASGEEVFSTLYEYDELDRCVSITDNLGNTTSYAYDSRDALYNRVDQLGNVAQTNYDMYGAKIGDTKKMTATGLGGGPHFSHASTNAIRVRRRRKLSRHNGFTRRHHPFQIRRARQEECDDLQ